MMDKVTQYVSIGAFIYLCCFSYICCGTANFRAVEKRILDTIIGHGNYDSRIRPSGNNTVKSIGSQPKDGQLNYGHQDDQQKDGPCFVYVNIFLRSISKISDLDMEYSCQITFREQWNDDRLKYDDLNGKIRYLTLTDPNKIWKPDLFFSNEKEGHFHDIIMPNVLLRIHPNGNILYSIRISLILSCPMDLKYYPMDLQTCQLKMASYGYTTEDVVFQWKEKDPVQVTKNLHLPTFTLARFITDYCTSRTNTGEYSCIVVKLVFKREFSYYLIQIYIPCCMLVIVSWVSFWLDPNAIPARVSLGVTTLLTMATQISGINASLPPVSYTKAIDVWTGVCLTFVFGALLEFALVNYASRSDAHRAAQKKQKEQNQTHVQQYVQPPNKQTKWDVEHGYEFDTGRGNFIMKKPSQMHPPPPHLDVRSLRDIEVFAAPPRKNWCQKWLSSFPTRSKRIDVISRIFFPLMFALFNVVYWTTYMFREDLRGI